MIDMIVEIVTASACTMVGAFLGTKLAKPQPPRQAPLLEPRCTGYVAGIRNPNGRFGPVEPRDDCRALRNPTCTDGRCSFHCASMCECDKSLVTRSGLGE